MIQEQSFNVPRNIILSDECMARDSYYEIFTILKEHYGEQKWWPAETTFEMAVGAVLTQNTNWNNVVTAIDRLREHNALDAEVIYAMDNGVLANLIHSAGYYNLKAKRLKNLIKLIVEEFDGEIENLFNLDMYVCREKLLGVKGVGEETADSILLYGGNFPIFVVDTYTHRVFSRHNLVAEESSYQEIQESFMGNLPEDSGLFNEYHALIVRVAKEFCKKSTPICDQCPLKGI